MLLAIDSRSAVPPFEQLRSQLVDMVASGGLPPGTRLPPIRTLAADLELAANTVARTYRELEEAGIVETRGRHGTFVLGPPPARPSAREREERLTRAAHAFAREVRLVGADPGAALQSVRDALGAVGPAGSAARAR